MRMTKNSPGIRLNKFLSLCGIASRRKCEELISEERIAVNGSIVTDFATYVQYQDRVTLDGEKISPQQLIYLLLNKPAGYITTLNDERQRKHIGLLLPKKVFVKPVGRLDKNTTGVLLFTNDGELHYRLTHPKYRIPRIYRVELDRPFDEKLAAVITEGVRLNQREIARGKVLNSRLVKKHSWLTLELREGLNREIHRMFKVLGYRVLALERVSYGGIQAGSVKQGDWRYLQAAEVRKLKELCGIV